MAFSFLEYLLLVLEIFTFLKELILTKDQNTFIILFFGLRFFFLALFRSCAQGQKQGLFQFEVFCALIDVSTRKVTTILASPMLGTLDVALHEDSMEFGQ